YGHHNNDDPGLVQHSDTACQRRQQAQYDSQVRDQTGIAADNADEVGIRDSQLPENQAADHGIDGSTTTFPIIKPRIIREMRPRVRCACNRCSLGNSCTVARWAWSFQLSMK